VNRMKYLPVIACSILFADFAHADPEADRQALVNYYQNRFPSVELQEYANGLYAFDQNAREQWLEMEDFPPYEIAIILMQRSVK